MNKGSFIVSSSDYPEIIRREAWFKACSDYENTFSEHKKGVINKREKTMEFLKIFNEELLKNLLNKHKLSHAISEFYSEEQDHQLPGSQDQPDEDPKFYISFGES